MLVSLGNKCPSAIDPGTSVTHAGREEREKRNSFD
jgi:hypothetical protein